MRSVTGAQRIMTGAITSLGILLAALGSPANASDFPPTTNEKQIVVTAGGVTIATRDPSLGPWRCKDRSWPSTNTFRYTTTDRNVLGIVVNVVGPSGVLESAVIFPVIALSTGVLQSIPQPFCGQDPVSLEVNVTYLQGAGVSASSEPFSLWGNNVFATPDVPDKWTCDPADPSTRYTYCQREFVFSKKQSKKAVKVRRKAMRQARSDIADSNLPIQGDIRISGFERRKGAGITVTIEATVWRTRVQ